VACDSETEFCVSVWYICIYIYVCRELDEYSAFLHSQMVFVRKLPTKSQWNLWAF